MRERLLVAAPQSAPVYSAVCGRTNLLLVLFMAVYHLVSNFYLETQIDQFERLFGDEVRGAAIAHGPVCVQGCTQRPGRTTRPCTRCSVT